jgi:hypothetical protein
MYGIYSETANEQTAAACATEKSYLAVFRLSLLARSPSGSIFIRVCWLVALLGDAEF